MTAQSGRTPVRSDTFIRFGFYALLLIVVASALGGLGMLLEPLVASVLLMFLLEPIVNYCETKGVNRLVVVVGLYCVVTVALAVVLFVIVPIAAQEASSFAADMPHYKTMVRETLGTLRARLMEWFPQLAVPDLYELLSSKARSYANVDMSVVLSYVSSAFSILSVVVIVPVITFFLLLEGHIIGRTFLRLVPNRYFEMFVLLFHKVTRSVQLFIRGQLIDALAVGIMTSIGLTIIGLPYSLVIGVIAGMGNLIPYLGPIIGFIPALFAVAISPEGFTIWGLVQVVAVFAIVQFLEGTFVYPIAVGSSVNLHPLLVILGITVGGRLGGVIGMLIAIPLISVVKVTVEVLYSSLKSYSII